MFKEFGLIFIIFVLAVLMFKRLYHRNITWFRRIAAGSVILAVLVNIIYNLSYIYPDFVYEGVPIGDSRRNLFVYKEDSQFQWQILNTVTRNRYIMLDSQGGFYERYFTLFGRGVQSIKITEEEKDRLPEAAEEFLCIDSLDAVEQMPYAFPDWDGENVPVLYLNVDSLKGNEVLACIVDASNNLYIMSQEYYESMIRKEDMP